MPAKHKKVSGKNKILGRPLPNIVPPISLPPPTGLVPTNYYRNFLNNFVVGQAPANFSQATVDTWPDVNLTTPEGKITNDIAKKFLNVNPPGGTGLGIGNLYDVGPNGDYQYGFDFVSRNPFLNLHNPTPSGTIGHELIHANDHQRDKLNSKVWGHLQTLHNAVGSYDFKNSLGKIQNKIDPTGGFSSGYPLQRAPIVNDINTWRQQLANPTQSPFNPTPSSNAKKADNWTHTFNAVDPVVIDPYPNGLENLPFILPQASEYPAHMSENLHNSWGMGEHLADKTTPTPNSLNPNERTFVDSILGDMDTAYPAAQYPDINHHINERRNSVNYKTGGSVKSKYNNGGYVMNNDNLRSRSPYNQFEQTQFQNTNFNPYTSDNFAVSNRQPYIEGVSQGQVGNPMSGQFSESSLYPLQSSTDTPYLNNTGYSSYADGGRVTGSTQNDLANNARSRLNVLGLSQLMRNYASEEREHMPGFASYADGGHVDSLQSTNPEFEEEIAFSEAPIEEIPMVDASQFDTDMEQSEEYKPYHSLAEIIRQQGEGEDTILAHINPIEAEILKSMGGSGTINPKTGLPQFGLFSNPKKWFKSVVGPAAGVVLGNMILPGLGGIIGGALGGAAGSSIRGRKDHLQSALRGASMGAAAPTAAGLLGSGASSIGGGSVSNYLTNYGNTNAILPSLGIGNSGGVPAGESTASTVGREAGKKAVEQSFADKLMVNSKDFFTQPANLMSTAVLANQLIPQKEKKVKETTPEEIAANEKRYRNASRLSQAELESEAAYSLAQREAKRRARNNLYGLESSSVTPLYRKVNSPAEYENTRRWLEYYDNPEFTGNQVRMKEGGAYLRSTNYPTAGYEIEYPMGIIGYLQGHSGGQDDDINAKLSDGEYVIDASTVSDLGDGNNANGAKKLDQMRRNIRAHKRGGSIKMPPKAKSLLSYMRG